MNLVYPETEENITIKRGRTAFEKLTAGVYVLPAVLSRQEIASIVVLDSSPISCGPAWGDPEYDGDWQKYHEEQQTRPEPESAPKPEKTEPEKKKEDKTKEKISSHGNERRPLYLPWVARLIWSHISQAKLGGLKAYGVDSYMKLYRIQPGQSVQPHTDEDFPGPQGSVALASILLYLNDEYEGGETVFNGGTRAEHIKPGGGLFFRHDIVHEGLPVESGVKIVLKTDLFYHS